MLAKKLLRYNFMIILEIYDISWLKLFLSYILLIIPFAVLWIYQTGLMKDTFVGVVRMTLQLFLLGLYLEYLFKLNSTLVNILWVMAMIGIAVYTILKRAKLNYKWYALPILLAMLSSLLIVDAFFLGFTIQLENLFDARYLIPITGMLIGNSIERNILALSHFNRKLTEDKNIFRYSIANGATRSEAVKPFIKEALKLSFNPFIAQMAIIGLISMPGTMTGQILGGSSPAVAIKYQIMLMLSIFVVTITTVILSIILSQRYIFDAYDNVKNDL